MDKGACPDSVRYSEVPPYTRNFSRDLAATWLARSCNILSSTHVCMMAQQQEDVKSSSDLRSSSATDQSEESQNSDDSYSGSDDDDQEPVLKYKRFAKEVVQSTCDGSEKARDGSEGDRDVINCITVHPKVSNSQKSDYTFWAIGRREF